MNLPNEIHEVDPNDGQCQRFEQRLDACLDGRASGATLASLASDPHLECCPDCRVSFDVYRQFDRAGGAVLNGGAGLLGNRSRRSHTPFKRWLPFASSALALSAALMIAFVAAPTQNGQATDAISALAVNDTQPADLVLETGVRSELEMTMLQFYEVGAISQRFLSSELIAPIAGDRSAGTSGWENPWQYTSELPGLRPFHRTAKVALVLYNDSMNLL